MVDIKTLVLRQLRVDPDINLKACQLVVPGLKKDNFYKIKREQNKPNKPSKQKKTHASGSAVKPSTTLPLNIDDPDELLYSVAIRELNKATPDPRWATILIQCRKEIGKRKSEVIDTLQKLPTKQLTEMLKSQSGKYSRQESLI